MVLTGVGGTAAAGGGDSKTGGAAGVACIRAGWGLGAAGWTGDGEAGIGAGGEETGGVAWSGRGDA